MLKSNSPAAGFLAGLKNWKSKPARHQKWKCVKFEHSFRVQVPARPRVGVRWGFYWRRASGYGNLPGLCLPHGIRGEVSKMTKIEFSQNQDLSEPKWPGGIRDDHGKSSVASWRSLWCEALSMIESLWHTSGEILSLSELTSWTDVYRDLSAWNI